MPLPITSLYAAPLALLFVILTQLVIVQRTRAKVFFGDGGQPPLIEAIRRQGNFVEAVPLALLLLALAETRGAEASWLHIFGATLLVARLIHPFGISLNQPGSPLRIAGAVATTLVTVALAATLLLQLFF